MKALKLKDKGVLKMLVTENLEMQVKQNPEKIYTIFQGREWTYNTFFEKVKRVAAYFQSKNYKKGDIIALYSLNSDVFLVCYYGILLGGFSVLPINTKLVASEVEYQFSHAEPKALIYDVKLEETLKKTSYEFQDILKIGEIDTLGKVTEDKTLEFEPVVLEGEDTSVIMYTSGTTGKPKGVMLTNNNLKAAGEIWSESMNITSSDRMLVSTPLFHCAAIHILVVPITYNGGTLIIEEVFSPTNTLKALQEEKPTIFFGVPAMYGFLLNRPNIKEIDLPTLRLFASGAAPLPYELIKNLKETFPNVEVQNSYGQTENVPAATSIKNHLILEKIGSVGEALPQTEVQAINESGESVSVGEVGEVIVKGPQVMKGYLKDQEATNKALKNGWLYTGDLGKFDEEGLLYIVDRRDDMIIRAGENIYPIEVEEILYQIPELLESTVVGVPNEFYGEVPKAFVVIKEGETITEQKILNYCGTKLAKFKVPEEVEMMNELPRNASGKVLKHTLRVL